nr:hypothetical protein [uncultured Neisseria sp.]
MDTRSFILPLIKAIQKYLAYTFETSPKNQSGNKKKSSCKTGAFSWKKPDYFNLVSL